MKEITLFSRIKFILIMFPVFVAVTLIGMTLHELVRKTEARCLGYESWYCKGWGQLSFYSESMQAAFEPIQKANFQAIRSGSNFKDKAKWDLLIARDRKDHAFIRLSGLVFTFGISLAGLLLLVVRRKKDRSGFGWPDWAGVFLSLFIVKELVTSLNYTLPMRILCDDMKFSLYFNLPVWGTEWFIAAYSLIFSLFILLWFVPRNRIIPFLVAGIPGGLTGILLWFFLIGPLVFRG